MKRAGHISAIVLYFFTCSFASTADLPIALDYERVLDKDDRVLFRQCLEKLDVETCFDQINQKLSSEEASSSADKPASAAGVVRQRAPASVQKKSSSSGKLGVAPKVQGFRQRVPPTVSEAPVLEQLSEPDIVAESLSETLGAEVDASIEMLESAVGLSSSQSVTSKLSAMSARAPVLDVIATRVFASQQQFPPQNYAAYGIVAFRTGVAPENKARFDAICRAYMSAITHTNASPTPIDKQMVTVWPVNDIDVASVLNAGQLETPCQQASDHYDLAQADGAISAARRAGFNPDGRGPYLVAWAPGQQFGQPDTPVLFLNLSAVNSYEDASNMFLKWKTDIEEGADLWKNGAWDLENLRLVLKDWADTYGEALLGLIFSDDS